jgi:ribonuclease G
MSKLLLINATPEETRVALVENGTLAEYQIERARDRGVVGNIYRGKVVRVLPGMQAAFVDIGLAKAGFLHASDFHPGVADLPTIDEDALVDEIAAVTGDDGAAPPLGEPHATPATSEPQVPPIPIEERLTRGDEIIVQVAKEPFGSKGSRITSHISLPGR